MRLQALDFSEKPDEAESGFNAMARTVG